jgi:hypothetical protein
VTDRGSVDEKPKMPDDMVFLSLGRSMPRDLYLHQRRLINLFWIAALSPLALLIAGALTPDTALIHGAELFNSLFWVHFKQVSIEGCVGKCHMMAYGLVGIPISWLATVVAAIWAIPLAAQNWHAQHEAFRRGAAPYGRARNGKINPPAGFGMSVGVCGVSATVAGAVLFGLLLLLYLFGGSDRTVSRGRDIPPAVISFLVTVIMGLTQFLAVALMSFLTIIALSFKKA